MSPKPRRLRSLVHRRPAETSAIVAGIVALLASVGIDLSAQQNRILVAGVGIVAAVATWIVERRRRSLP